MAAEITVYSTPEYLYRYRGCANGTLDRELKAIEDGYVFCPKISDMNDPMEGVHDESRMFRALNKRAKTTENVKALIKASGIASLSESHMSEPMWAYYAANFSGICVEYNLSRLAYGLEDGIAIVRMQYSEKPPMLRANRITDEDRCRMALSTKTLRWATEREWRILQNADGPAAYRSRFPVVTGVYIGQRMKDAQATIVLDRMSAIGVPVHVMLVDKYAIEFSEMDVPSPPPTRPKRTTAAAAKTPPAVTTRAGRLLEKVRGGKVT